MQPDAQSTAGRGGRGPPRQEHDQRAGRGSVSRAVGPDDSDGTPSSSSQETADGGATFLDEHFIAGIPGNDESTLLEASESPEASELSEAHGHATGRPRENLSISF